MTEAPHHGRELNFSDDAIDAGVAAWFRVRQVTTDRSIMRERMRAAVDAVLTRSAADSTQAPTWNTQP